MTRIIIILILIFIILTLIKSFLKKKSVNLTEKGFNKNSPLNSKSNYNPGSGDKDEKIVDAKFEEFK